MAAMNLLEDWCRGMDVDIRRALLVTGIPQECGHVEIEETLRGFFTPLGTYQVLNKIFFREENAKAVLIEVGEGVNLSTIPREFPGRGGAWRVVCKDPTQDAEFLKNLFEFLESEGRTVEDVIRLLDLNPKSQSQSLHSENWAEALGVLLGAVVQIVFYMDAEIRHREEARAQELAEAEAAAAWASDTERKVKQEPEPATALALKMENRSSRYDMGNEASKPFVRKTRAKNLSRKKKQNRAPKQEPVFSKKTRGDPSNSTANVEGAEADDTENMETSESVCSSEKPAVKQEEPSPKKSGVRGTRKVLRGPPRDAPSEAESPGGVSEADQEGGREVPPKKKAVGWGSARRLAPMRKKKKVSLGPVSYVLVDSEDAKKKPMIPKKNPSWRKDPSVLKVPEDPKPVEMPASVSEGPKAEPEGSPHTSEGQSDHGGHLESVSKWMMWEEQEWEVEEEVPTLAVDHLGDEDGPSASEEAAVAAVKVQEEPGSCDLGDHSYLKN